MTLILNQQLDTELPIVADSLLPERMHGQRKESILAATVWHGNRKVTLGELFEVSGNLSDDLSIIVRGHTRPIQNLGCGMSAGAMTIDGDVGAGCGRQMSGGILTVNGNAGHQAGCEMTGGMLTIHGDAGDSVGGGYPGNHVGMNGGTIVVTGSVGDAAGDSMRRGTIVVGGSSGRLLGWHMLAGTIIIAGDCGVDYGVGMKRGTIVIGQQPALPPSVIFAPGSVRPVPVLELLGRWLDELTELSLGAMLRGPLTQFHGDLTMGGRGELFLANGV